MREVNRDLLVNAGKRNWEELVCRRKINRSPELCLLDSDRFQIFLEIYRLIIIGNNMNLNNMLLESIWL